MKCGKKSYFIKNCKGSQQNYTAKGTNTAWNNNHVKVTKECLIKYFAFCYNSIYKVYKDTKYSIK